MPTEGPKPKPPRPERPTRPPPRFQVLPVPLFLFLETAIFSLMGSLSRPNVKDHRRSTRTGLCAVLPSVDGTIGSEICNLLAAYDQLKLPGHRSSKASDHFVWLKPYRPKKDTSIFFANLARPFLDIGRAQRIVRSANGEFEIWACPNNTIRVTGTDPWLADPHTPRVTDSEGTKRYKLARAGARARTRRKKFGHLLTQSLGPPPYVRVL
jgi:hypothetical protein